MFLIVHTPVHQCFIMTIIFFVLQSFIIISSLLINHIYSYYTYLFNVLSLMSPYQFSSLVHVTYSIFLLSKFNEANNWINTYIAHYTCYY